MPSPTNEEEHPLVTENRILNVRLRLAQAFHGLLLQAFDALLTHSVNYRNLPEYKDSALLDKALDNGVSVASGEANLMRWIEKCRNGISSAIRRKQFRKIERQE